MLTSAERKHVESAAKLLARNILTFEETLLQLRDHAIDAKLAEVLPLLPAEIASRLQDAVARWPALKAVGYWRPIHSVQNDWEARLPHPKNLVDPSWRPAQRLRILSYLQTGRVFCQWRGLSYCRFACGIEFAKMGSRCVTDGVWVWPEGLAHYIECHGVFLPSDFVATMMAKRWVIPQKKRLPTYEKNGQPDYSDWIAWAEKHSVSQRETEQPSD